MDSKISGLTQDTTPSDDDLVAMVDDPAGTPITKYVTKSNFTKTISTNTINENAVGNGVVVDGLTIEDGRAQLPYAYDNDNNTRTTTSTSYTDEPNCRVSLSLKAGDLVEVLFNCMLKIDSTSEISQGYIYDVSGDVSQQMVAFFSSGETSRYGSSATSVKVFRANSDTTVTFGTKWRSFYSGTSTRHSAVMTAKVISW